MRLIDADAFEQDLKEKLLPLLVEKYGKEEAMKGLHFSLQDCISNIQSQPTITQQDPEWIPCSRRLPDDLAEVNVTYVNHDPEPYYVFTKDKPYTASAVYYKGNWYWYSSTCADYLGEYGRNDVDKVDDAIEITAWKPLPEPYRGEQK